MKKVKLLLLFLAAVWLLISCQKGKTSSPDVLKQTNVSKLIIQKSGTLTDAVNQSPFVIHSAGLSTGLYQAILYMSVSFTGGEKVHQFTVNWNGNIINEADKKVIELVVYHSDEKGDGLIAGHLSQVLLRSHEFLYA